MIRLAVLCLPFLAMACASADEPDSFSSLPELEQLPSFYGPNCQRGRQYWSDDWQRGLPPDVSRTEIAASVRTQAAPNATCDAQAFAVRRRHPLEYWILCADTVVHMSYRPNAFGGERGSLVISSCNSVRRDALAPDPLNAINQDNTQERSD